MIKAVLIAMVIVASCWGVSIGLHKMWEYGNTTNRKTICPYTEETTYKINYRVVVLDSCEYIQSYQPMVTGSTSLTHKGNCKFCKERN